MAKRCNLKCPRCHQLLAIHPGLKLGDPVYVHRHRAARRNAKGQTVDPLNRCMYIFTQLTPARKEQLDRDGFINVPLGNLQEMNPAAHKPTARELARQQFPEHSPWDDDAEHYGYH